MGTESSCKGLAQTMPTITTILKTEDHYGIGSITCGPKVLSDALVFFPPNIFGTLQAIFDVPNTNRIMEHYKNGGTFDTIHNGDERYNDRQYLLFENNQIKTFTGDKVINVYEKYNDNIIVLANTIGSNDYGDSLYNSLVKNYSNDLQDCIVKSLKENIHIGFDKRCYSKGISSTTVYVAVYTKEGNPIYTKEIYSPDSEPISQL